MTNSAAERLATLSYNKLMFSKTGSFKNVELLRTTATTDKDGISNIVSIGPVTLPTTLNTIQAVVDHTNNEDGDGLQTAECKRTNLEQLHCERS